jgi:hypothetical protein
MKLTDPRKIRHSGLPGVYTRRHGVIGCGGSLVTLITPAHLWGCHGPATIKIILRTKQQQKMETFMKSSSGYNPYEF